MKLRQYNEKLEIEQEKLKMLANEAINKGIPLVRDEAFMAQNRKVDAFVVKIQREKEKVRNKQQER
jgi:hypothetical protein